MNTFPQVLSKYTRTAVVLHWVVAVLMVVNVGLALSVDSLPDEMTRPVIDLHKSIGITVLGLVLMRLLWRFAHPPPPLPSTYALWERRASHAAHIALYAVMLCLPLSGWLHDSAWKNAATHPMFLYGAVPWPRIGFVMGLNPRLKERLHDVFGEVHEAFGYALYALFALHLLGALKHQFIDKERELQRMTL